MSDTSTSDFADRGPTVLVVTTITLVLATVFVVSRFISRLGIVKHTTWDDYFIALGWLFAFGLSFSINYGTSKGLGRHDENIPDAWLPALRRCEYVFSVLYNPSLMATKTSILIFYLRLSRNTNRLLRIASYVTLGVVNVAGLVLTFLNVFQCSPVGAVFSDESVGKCIPLLTLYLASAPVNIITDLAILVLPIPVLTGMRLPQKQKTVLILTFALGIFVTVVDVVRIYYLQQASFSVAQNLTTESEDTTSRLGNSSSDFAWYASISLMWTAVEVNVGIICACIPTLKPLISRILPSWIGHMTRGETAYASFSKSSADHPMGQTAAEPTIAPIDVAPTPIAPAHAAPTNSSAAPPPLTGDPAEEMDFMDFLTMPEPESAQIRRTQTVQTHRTAVTETHTYFGFVNMRAPKSMLKTKGMEAFKYCTLVTILFFLWGFSYGLLNTLNDKIAAIFRSSARQSLGLQSAYFGAYFVAPPTLGQYVLRKGGFKATFITGLVVYGIGTLCFWPSAVLASYPGFIVSQFIVAFGLAVLETAANPFLALCGSPEYGEMRLLIAQGVQAIGSVLSPLLAENALFRNISDDNITNQSLIDVQWTYLAIALFDVVLALFFYYMPLPEATDDDLADAADVEPSIPVTSAPSAYKINVRKLLAWTLGLGIASQFLYVGAQESLSIFFPTLVARHPGTPALSASNALVSAHSTFAASRFVAGAMCLVIPPRLVLLIFYLLSVIFVSIVFALNTASATTIEALVIVLFAAEAPIWPLIFAIALRRQGRFTKWAAAGLTMGASGGAVAPWIVYGVALLRGVPFSFCVLVAMLGAGLVFPIWLFKVRGLIDPRPRRGTVQHGEPQRAAEERERQDSRSSLHRFGAKFSNVVRSRRSPGPKVEHRERQGSEGVDSTAS